MTNYDILRYVEVEVRLGMLRYVEVRLGMLRYVVVCCGAAGS